MASRHTPPDTASLATHRPLEEASDGLTDVGSPFDTGEGLPPERRRLDRLLRTARPDLARAAILHLLSALHPVDLAPEDFHALDERYGLTRVDGERMRALLWSEALEHFLADRIYTPAEDAYLNALQHAFGLPNGFSEGKRLTAAAAQFRAELTAIARDAKILPEERAHLSALVDALGLPRREADEAITAVARHVFDAALQRAPRVQGRLSRASVAFLRAAAADAGTVLTPAEDAMLAAADTYWATYDEARRREAELAEMERAASKRAQHDADVVERARLRAAIRKVKRGREAPRIGFDSLIADGPCFLAEPVTLHGKRPADSTNRFREMVRVQDDVGHLVVQAGEVIFEGQRLTRRIPLDDVVGAVTYPDGLRIQRSRDAAVELGVDHPERALLAALVVAKLKGWDGVPHDARPLVDQ